MVFEYCILGPFQLEEVLDLEAEILAALERPDLLRRNSREMWLACLNAPHTALGVRVEGKLVALAVLYIPEPGSEEDLSVLLHQPACASLKSANYKICLVAPRHRGHGLQQQLGLRLEEYAHRQGVALLCSTASPHNPASIRSLENLGYRLSTTLTKYGFTRNLYYKIVNGEW